MSRLILATATLLISVQLVAAGDLETYKAAYEKSMEGLHQHENKLSKLNEQYAKALDNLLSKVKKTGDLDDTVAVVDEIERFKQEGSAPREPSTFPALQERQSFYMQQATHLAECKSRDILNLARKYDALLEPLQRELVASNKVDEAMAVQAERKRVASSEAVVWATQSVARLAKASAAEKQSSVTLRNIAAEARISASSEYNRYWVASKAVDGIYQLRSSEWASKTEGKGTWIKLQWESPQVIHKIVLYGRVNNREGIREATLRLGSHYSIKTGTLPIDGSAVEIKLESPVKTEWVRFKVDKIIKDGGLSVGLGEIEVFAE